MPKDGRDALNAMAGKRKREETMQEAADSKAVPSSVADCTVNDFSMFEQGALSMSPSFL